jgi:tetratricopeptide (TPR) repeat protein
MAKRIRKTQAKPTAISGRRVTAPGVVLAAALIALELWVFLQLRTHHFITLDDSLYVTGNPVVKSGLTWSGVAWAFTTAHAANWHPLTWLSHMLDVSLFGLDAGSHHLTSLVLHIASTLLLFRVMFRMTGALGRSAFVAALFGVHPAHVESVAWIAERKDVLSTLFWWLTIWAYVRYVRRPVWSRYALVIVIFACGLMTKPMLVTLPLVLLLLDVWPLKRASSWISLVREKLPLLVLVLISSVVTVVVQRSGGAVVEVGRLPIYARVENAVVSYAAYLGKAFWPVSLCVFYPFPSSIALGQVGLALCVLLGVTIAAIAFRRRYPYLLVGWLWYLGTLVPVIGLVQVGEQSMADRYTYVSFVGIFIAVAWGLPDLIAGVIGSAREAARRRADVVLGLVAMLVIGVLTGVARIQVSYWIDDLTLWRHVVEVVPTSAVAEANLGGILGRSGKWDEARTHFEQALRLNPDLNLGRQSLAVADHEIGLELTRQGKVGQAAAAYRESIRAKPDFAVAHHDLGLALFSQGLMEDAIREDSEAIRLEPRLESAWNNRGLALASTHRLAEALSDFTEAVRLAPGVDYAHLNRGLVLREMGRLEEARREFADALRINPRNQAAIQALASTKGR